MRGELGCEYRWNLDGYSGGGVAEAARYGKQIVGHKKVVCREWRAG